MAESAKSEAFNQTIQGKRHLLIKDYYSAVQSFEKVCQLLDELYGKGADECGDAYLNYGVALLELARQETGALEGVVNANINDPSASEGSEDDDNSEEEDGDGEGEGEGEEEAGNEDSAPAEADDHKDIAEEDLANEDGQANGNENNEESQPEIKGIANGSIPEQPLENSAPFDPNQPSTSTGITENKEEDDDPTTIEISWEVLSMAKDVFERLLSKGSDVRYKLAETLQKMGEIATEWENNELAIKLLNSCLDLRKDSLPDDDRLIAETYYHIGNAHSFISEIDQANGCFQMAINVIQKRIENKRKSLENENLDSETRQSIIDEIKDLEDLLPDMVARIEDKRDQMATVEQALRMEAQENKEAQIATQKICEPKPVNNVSHLVKRKRREQGNEEGVKKICTASDP